MVSIANKIAVSGLRKSWASMANTRSLKRICSSISDFSWVSRNTSSARWATAFIYSIFWASSGGWLWVCSSTCCFHVSQQVSSCFRIFLPAMVWRGKGDSLSKAGDMTTLKSSANCGWLATLMICSSERQSFSCCKNASTSLTRSLALGRSSMKSKSCKVDSGNVGIVLMGLRTRNDFG